MKNSLRINRAPMAKKNFTYSSWHDVTRTLSMTVGSPSAHRRGAMLKLISVLVLILTIGVGNVWGTEEVYKTALFGSDYNDENQVYTSSFDATNGSFVVTATNFNNNKNGWTNSSGLGQIKCGRKNNASIGTITTKAAIDDAITKVVVTVDAFTSGKVNSFKLYVASNSTFTQNLQTITATIKTGANTFTVTTPTASRYYKVEIDCASGSSNGLVTISKVEYYHSASSGCSNTPTMSFTPNSVEKTVGDNNFTKAVSISGKGGSQTVAYSSSNTDVATVNPSTGEVTIKTNGSTTITASVAENGDYCSASATYTLTVNKPSYTVNWYVGGTQVKTESVTKDEKATMPSTPADNALGGSCSSLKFMGWSETNIGSTGTTAPLDLFTAAPTITSAKNYYAVFAESSIAFEDDMNISGTNGVNSRAGWASFSSAYGNNGCIRLSTGSATGSMSTNALTSLTSATTQISFKIKAWSGTENGQVTLSASKGTIATTSFTATTTSFTDVSTTITGGDNTTTITFTGTSGKRINIKDISIGEVSNYVTTCCTPLASINGSVTLSQSGNDLVASGWEATTGGNETGYLVKLYNNDKSSVITSGSTDGTAKTYTFENPGAGTYWVSVTPTYSGAGNYCASGDETFSAASIDISGKVVITFKKNGATGTDDQTQEVDYNSETALEDVSDRSYTAPSCKEFGGWASSQANATAGTVAYANGANITATEATTLWAIWKTKTFAVTDGTIAASVASYSYSANPIACGSDLTITCEAAAAYKGNPTVTATGTHGDITVNSATSVTIANVQSAIAVSIAYNTPKETATVILHDATGAHTQDGSYYEADNYTLPNTAAACTESELYGWYTETYVDQPTAPSGEKYIAKEASKALVAGENHFYAVYATIEDRYTNNYTKITSAGDLTSGDYLISSGSYCMKNTVNGARMDEVSITASGNVKTTENTTCVWTITKNGSRVTLFSGEKYLAINSGAIAMQAGSYEFTFDYGTTKSNSWTFTSVTEPTQQLSYSGSPKYFRPATSQTDQIDLYKRDKAPSAGAPYTTSPSCTSHTLSSAIDPSSPVSGTVDLGKTTILEGKTTTAEATPSAHYTFSHWTISGTGALLSDANANPVTVTMGTADAEITAHFTEKEKCTVEFYNNGGSALSSTTYWLGETPTAPTLTDGHDHDACDENSTVHYGWTQTAWTETLTQEQVDAKTAADVKVYAKAATLPAITAEDDGNTIEYHAVWAQASGGGSASVFSEGFSSCEGTGGNDDSWSGSIATTTLPTSISSSWSITAGNAAKGCIKLGAGSTTGHAITPSIDCGSATTATLTFRAGAWNNNDDGTTLTLSYTNCSGDKSSVTLAKGSFTEYTVNLSNITDDIKIDFYVSDGSKHRFFLDDVDVTCAGGTSYSNYITTCIPSHSISSAVDPVGKATVTLGANSVAEGSTTTAEYSAITAGYEFVNWTISGTGASLDDNTANPTTITMGTADVTVTANLQCITPSISVQPAASTTCLIGATPELSVTAAAGGASLSYQWQQCATIDGTYVNVASAGTSSTYSPSTATEGTTYYKCVVTNAATGCSTNVTSDPATVTVNAPSGYCISLYNSNNNGIQGGFSNGGSGNEYTLAFTIPGKDGSSNWPEYWIGENEAWASFSANATFANMELLSAASSTLGLAEGATGKLHIWDNNKTDGSNLWVKFEPDGYGFRWGDHESDDWTATECTKAFTVDANNANTYWTELVTLDGTNNTAWDYYVGLKTASGYVYSGVDNEASDARGISRTRSVTAMKVSNGTAGQYKETFLNSEATGTTGKFRIWNNNITDYNFVCHFVPFYQLKYNANGGSGTMDPLPATPVSCEESTENRTVTVAANTFTAPTGKQFVKWNTAANGSGADVATGAYELTGDVTLYAIWADADYTVIVNQSPAAGATTTGQTSAAHYGATINLTTTVPDGYEFINWTSSDVTITNPTSEDGASFTMPAQNVTVTANFQQIYTITWSANGVTTTSMVNAGNKLVLPASDPTSCNAGYSTFIGWYSVAAGTAEDPSDNVSGTKADADHTPTGDETYYAVWANGDLVGGWQKVTSIAVGDVVLFVHEESYKRELTGVSSNIGTATAYETTLAGTYPLTVMAGSENNSYAFKNSSNYLSYTGTGNELNTSETLNAASSWTISTSEGGNFKFANVNTTTRILQFNNSQFRWACYANSGQTAFQIYKQVAGATEFISSCCKEWSAPEISYSAPDHWKAGDGDVAVSIAAGDTYGAVSFESSDDDVLTVNSTTGAIHAVAMGTATVTATWAGGIIDAVRYCTASSSVEVAVSGTVTVTFNGNDATSGSMDNQVIYYNEATALSVNAFARTGYTFYGWAETEEKADAGNRDYEGGESVTFTTDKTLYAVWRANTHKVTLTQPTGNTITATGAADLANVGYGTSITLSAEENDGYVFTGWSASGVVLANTNPVVFTMPDNDVTVTATYSTYTWDLTGYTVETAPKISYYKVEKFSTAGVVIKENYKRSDNDDTKQETYAGAWTAKLNGVAIANGADLSLEDNGKTLKLYIGEEEIASYTLTVNDIDVDQFVVGIWDIEAPSVQINTYTMPTLSDQTAGDAATCKDHNIFIGWTSDPDDPKDANIIAGGTEGIVASNTTYYAVWAKNGTITDDVEKNTIGGTETSATLNAAISYSTGQGGGTISPGVYNNEIRLYQNSDGTYGGFIKFTASTGYTIKAITLTTSTGSEFGYELQSDYEASKMTAGTISNHTIQLTSLTASNVIIAAKGSGNSSRLNISAMSVTYETTGPTDYIVDCEARYEIRFDANGATGSYDPIKKAADKTIELPSGSLLSKEYHNFAGWKIGAVAYEAGDTYTVAGEDAVENIITVMAQWSPFSQGAVTVDGEALEGSPFYATQSYTLPTPDAISGKRFIGWSDGENIVAPGEYAMPDPAVPINYTSQWFDLLPKPSGVSFTDGEWILVTAQDQLHAGDFIVVAAANADYAMGAEASGGNNRTPQAVTKSGNTLSYESDVVPLFLQNGYGANQYALYDMSAEKYLYAASSGNNYLKIDTDFDQNGSWLITIANGSTSVMAQGANTHNDLRYNAGNSVANSVFSCYLEGGQQPIALYRWIKTIKTEGTVDASDVMPTYNVNLVVQTNTSIDMDVERTVNDFYIEAMEGESGQVKNPENLNINGNAYYDLTLNTSGTMDNSKWYAFAVPFQVDAATGIQRLSNDGKTSNAGFNSHYVLLKYNSANYASAGQGWEYVQASDVLMPGKFYMIALNSNEYNRVRMTKKAGTPLNNKAELSLTLVGEGAHANWNALANNALAYANVSATGTNADLKVQVYNSAGDNYTALGFDEVTFTVGTPFFFQAAKEGTMSVEIAVTNNETVKAPARYTATTEEFKLRLGADTESFYDQLYVSASDEALNEYQIGHDLAKAGVSTTVPQMYIPAYGVKLCDAEFPLANNEATFPLTFTTPTAGTYQLYIAQAAQNAELYLQRDGNIIWNLTTSPYALTLNQGTTENYSLLLKAVAETPTDIENTDALNGANGVQKVIIDEHVYILRGEQLFDVTGKAVKK